MNKVITICTAALLLLALFSCGEAPEKRITTTTKATSAPPTPTPIKHEPFVIVDSSKVKNLEGGVKMYIIEEGNGPIPTVDQTVVAHYHGMLTNGDVFDSSYDRGSTSAFALKQVIRGWTISLSQVRCGSQVKLVIPPEMGYGANARSNIPANSTLIFDVELMRAY